MGKKGCYVINCIIFLMGRKHSGKGDSAFSPFDTLFSKGYFLKVFNPFPNKPWFLRVCSTSLLKTMGKGEIARYEQFLLFPQCFLPVWRAFCHFHEM